VRERDTHTQTHTRAHTHTHTHTRARVLFSFRRLPLVSVYRLSYPSSLSAPFSCLSMSFYLAFVLLVSLLYIFTVYVCACAHTPRFNRCTRFHAQHDTIAARGRLCTWVNGKMSFETFLGRSRSPHCQSYTRAIPFHASRSRENAARVSPGFSPREEYPAATFSFLFSFFFFFFSSLSFFLSLSLSVLTLEFRCNEYARGMSLWRSS